MLISWHYYIYENEAIIFLILSLKLSSISLLLFCRISYFDLIGEIPGARLYVEAYSLNLPENRNKVEFLGCVIHQRTQTRHYKASIAYMLFLVLSFVCSYLQLNYETITESHTPTTLCFPDVSPAALVLSIHGATN